jgi:2-polyprenyl-3-methyl-5-hydroxy-6-metoxy-1,4-benzoquinol methylase
LETEEKLLTELQSHYGVGSQYVKAYLDFFQRSQNQAFHSLQEILDLPPPAPMWFDYALSTNYRGQQLYQLMAPYLPERPQRYLDIGCGFGGCLVAFGRQGMEVCGIEIDQQRIEFAKANCQDFQVHAGLFLLSVLEDHIEKRLGTFDVITCMDVIEHVLDVPKALQKMASLLKPGGLLVLEIPNKDSLSFVASDGHFNLFGITLLERPEAIEYHSKYFSFDYDIGYYHPLNFYEDRLRELSLQCQPMSSSTHPMRELKETARLIFTVIRSYIKFLTEDIAKLPAKLNQRIQRRFASYMYNFLKDLSNILGRPSAIELFRRQYLTDFWTLIAYKK